jgi:hypothetical protein
MVTPADNNDADAHTPTTSGGTLSNGTPTELPFESAEDGNAVTYLADPTIGGFGNAPRGLGNQYIAVRQPAGGWQQKDLQPDGRRATYYRGFSSDLSRGILVSGAEAEPRMRPLSPSAPGEGYGVLYECNLLSGCQTPEEGQAAAQYVPLYGKPANRSPAEFVATENNHHVYISDLAGASNKGAVFAGGSENFDTLLMEANDALPGIEMAQSHQLQLKVEEEMRLGEDTDHLYERDPSGLHLVDLLPENEGGQITGDATFGAPPFSGSPGINQPDFSGVISRDGSAVFWTDLGNGKIYVRLGNSRTLQVSSGSARYWTSSTDGRYAIYSESAVGQEGQEEALYRFDVVTDTREVLAPSNGSVLGVLGASGDGQRVYFVAQGALNAQAGVGGVAAPVAGQPNLYLVAGGNTFFIATLSYSDGTEVKPFKEEAQHNQLGSEYGDWTPGLGQRTAEVSASGEDIVFMSNRRLAVAGFPGGYPNEGQEEVYLYASQLRELICVSCNPDGEPPPESEAGATGLLPVSWVETILPRWLSRDGSRVFFDSASPLVPQDTNGLLDVYEWEKEGTGSCERGDGVNDGCVSLVSGGASPYESWLLSLDANGNNVFIATRAQLTSQDLNEAYDVYDARIGGVRPPVPIECEGTACQGSPAFAPVFAVAPSVTFEGIGNFPSPQEGRVSGKRRTRAQGLKGSLRKCHHRQSRQRRRICERAAKARYLRPGEHLSSFARRLEAR